MANFYSIIQYVPNPMADERVNIGVVVFGEGQVLTRFLRDWRRVNRFAERDVGFLREFARDFAERTADQLALPIDGAVPRVDEHALQMALGRWTNVIRLSEPRPSLLPVRELLPRAASLVLWDRRSDESALGRRHRSDAARIAFKQVEFVVRGRLSREHRPQIARRHVIEGASFEHQFDVVLRRAGDADDRPMLAMHAISFEVGGIDALVKATAFTVKDVRDRHPQLPVAVLALLPPGEHLDLVGHAREAVEKYGGAFLSDEQATDWIEPIVLRQAS